MELLVIIITLALIFDYINGFHDAANSIATIVSTKVLTPFQAVIWAAFFNFVAFFIAKCIIGGFGIANTVSKTVVEQYISLPIILSGVIAAIVWNLFTWWKGIPSSSSHTLIGGFAGAAIMAHGFDAIQLNIILLPLDSRCLSSTFVVVHIRIRLRCGLRNCSLFLRLCSV